MLNLTFVQSQKKVSIWINIFQISVVKFINSYDRTWMTKEQIFSRYIFICEIIPR